MARRAHRRQLHEVNDARRTRKEGREGKRDEAVDLAIGRGEIMDCGIKTTIGGAAISMIARIGSPIGSARPWTAKPEWGQGFNGRRDRDRSDAGRQRHDQGER
jgi:hypothetical protein